MINSVMPAPTAIYNDNTACIVWSKATRTKGLRHIQMRENAIQESVANDFVSISYVEGKVNLADVFTKEDKDVAHFQRTRDIIMNQGVKKSALSSNNLNVDKQSESGTPIPTSTSPTPTINLAQEGVNLVVGGARSLAAHNT